MGVSVDAQLNPENQYLKDVSRINEILFLRGVSLLCLYLIDRNFLGKSCVIDYHILRI